MVGHDEGLTFRLPLENEDILDREEQFATDYLQIPQILVSIVLTVQRAIHTLSVYMMHWI